MLLFVIENSSLREDSAPPPPAPSHYARAVRTTTHRSTYNNTPFDRTLRNFLINGVDHSGTGRQSRAPFAKCLPDQRHASLTFYRCFVVAVDTADRVPNTWVGSQVFITLAPAMHLDRTCTTFAHVIHGVTVVGNMGGTDADIE